MEEAYHIPAVWTAQSVQAQRESLGVVIWRVLAVEVVVVGLGGGLLHLVLGAIVIVLTLGLRPVVGPLDAAPVIRGQELVHRVVRGVFVLGVRDDVAVLELVVIVIVIAVDRRARGLRLRSRLQLEKGIIVRRILTVEVVVVGLGGGLLHLVLGAIVVVLTLSLRPVVGPLDAAPVIRGQELVHRVVRGVFVLGVRDDVSVLELVVVVIVIAVNR